MKKLWLKDWPWQTVVTINSGLCREKRALHQKTLDGMNPLSSSGKIAVKSL
jgi:hypothetical protein